MVSKASFSAARNSGVPGLALPCFLGFDPGLGADFTTTGVSNSDYGVRNANGLMYDPIRNVGFYFQFGETIGLARWFRIDLDVGLGAQIRFP